MLGVLPGTEQLLKSPVTVVTFHEKKGVNFFTFQASLLRKDFLFSPSDSFSGQTICIIISQHFLFLAKL